jgi:hypothetical protein
MEAGGGAVAEIGPGLLGTIFFFFFSFLLPPPYQKGGGVIPFFFPGVLQGTSNPRPNHQGLGSSGQNEINTAVALNRFLACEIAVF